MKLLSPHAARAALRSYPLKAGQAELKRLLAGLFPQQQSVSITTIDRLYFHLNNYKDNNRIFWWFEEVEAALQFYIRRFLPVGGHVLDVGANTGIIGLLAARLKSAQIKFVEANAEIVKTLEKTLRLNPALEHLCHLYGQPCALGPLDPRFPSRPGITIEKIIVDSGWEHVDLLKVDVDGPDFDVLSSAGTYLRPDFIEVIYIETEIAHPSRIIQVAQLGYTPYATNRTHLPDLRKLWINQTESHHFQLLDCDALTEDNVPPNVLFLAEKSRVNAHFQKWCCYSPSNNIKEIAP